VSVPDVDEPAFAVLRAFGRRPAREIVGTDFFFPDGSLRDLPVKERGTWAGQTFDAVQIDPLRGLVHFTRVGGGNDRTLHLRPLALRVGETARLDASHLPLSQRPGISVVWGSYDADRAVSRPNPARKYDRFTDYFHTVADIAPDGTLRALSPGEAVAVSRAADGVREYIPVTVTS